jgi:hypothetical protein
MYVCLKENTHTSTRAHNPDLIARYSAAYIYIYIYIYGHISTPKAYGLISSSANPHQRERERERERERDREREREREIEGKRESVTDRQTGKEQRRGLCTPHDCIWRAQKHALNVR